MKYRWKVITSALAFVLGGSLLLVDQANAQGPKRQMGNPQVMGPLGGGPGGRGFDGPGGRRFGGLMLGGLDLTDAQKEQIRALVAANREATEPYRLQMRDASIALREATANGQFIEQQVRAIAQAQAAAQVEMTVAGERLKASIYSLLTPEQRAKLAERAARIKDRRSGN